MNKKNIIILGLLLGIISLQPQVTAQIIWVIKRMGYSALASDYGTAGWEEIKDNIADIILANPPVEELHSLMTEVMKLVFAFYIPAIISLGFYILFLSSSSTGRAKAKDMLGKLIVGLVMISVSPQLINILLSISEQFTSSILAHTEKTIMSNALSETIGTGPPLPSGLIGVHHMFTLVNIELGFYLFLFFMVLVWGTFMFPLVIRFLAVSTFIVLFPLSIFLYSFEFSRALGRMMMEQTLVWIFLQAINALILLTATLCILSLPPDFMDISTWWLPLPGIIPAMVCFMFPIAPLFIIRFFRGFLP
ncbi:MAG: hypothetical protein KAU03_06660 [Candidatus Altiarchaeales archaeon]|nr:hypothetical protein [Candidatus Altiarchaeales archaeon]